MILHSPRRNSSAKYGIIILVIAAEHEVEERNEIRRQWASVQESNMQKLSHDWEIVD